MLSPRPAEARMSKPTGHRRVGEEAWPLEGGEWPLRLAEVASPFSRPSRTFRASYMFPAFLSTLFTITDWKKGREGER